MSGGPITARDLTQPDSYLVVNGSKFNGVQIEDHDATGNLIDAINAAQDDTGVVASISDQGELVMIAEDGRNIEMNLFQGGVSPFGPNIL